MDVQERLHKDFDRVYKTSDKRRNIMKVKFFLYRKHPGLSVEDTTAMMQKEVNNFIEDKDVIDIKSSITPEAHAVSGGQYFHSEIGSQYIMVTIMYNDKANTKKESEKGESL